MEFDTQAAKEIKRMLPHGALKLIHERLDKRGVVLTYKTVKLFKNQEVIAESVKFLEELAEEKKQQRKNSKAQLNKLRLGLY